MMKKRIWSNHYEEIEAIANDILKDDVYYKDVTDEEDAYCEAVELNDTYLDDEITNLSGITSKMFVARGKIVRWNGARSVYKILNVETLGDAILDVFSSFSGDNTFDVYVDETGDVTVTQLGHDNPVNPAVLVIRALDGFDDAYDAEEAIYQISDLDFDKISKKLGTAVGEAYGWEVGGA